MVREACGRDELEERRRDVHVAADARGQHRGRELAVIEGERREHRLADRRLPPLRDVVLVGEGAERVVARDEDEAVGKIFLHALREANERLVGVPDTTHATAGLLVVREARRDLRRVLHHAREVEAVFLVGQLERSVVRRRVEEVADGRIRRGFDAFRRLLEEDVVVDAEPRARRVLRADVRSCVPGVEADGGHEMLHGAVVERAAVPVLRAIAEAAQELRQGVGERPLPERAHLVELHVAVVESREEAHERRARRHASGEEMILRDGMRVGAEAQARLHESEALIREVERRLRVALAVEQEDM